MMTEMSWTETVADLYDRRGRHLWEYARRLGLDRGQAEDASHEAFARLLSLPGRKRPTEPDAWLFRTVHNLAMDRHRHSSRAMVQVTMRSATALEDLSERTALWLLVDALPPRQRLAVYLRYRADLAFSEIALVLDITEAGARANVFRAMESLRGSMEDRYER
jgi:RNA polymerase sigma factor (sigma-70 family)